MQVFKVSIKINVISDVWAPDYDIFDLWTMQSLRAIDPQNNQKSRYNL